MRGKDHTTYIVLYALDWQRFLLIEGSLYACTSQIRLPVKSADEKNHNFATTRIASKPFGLHGQGQGKGRAAEVETQRLRRRSDRRGPIADGVDGFEEGRFQYSTAIGLDRIGRQGGRYV